MLSAGGERGKDIDEEFVEAEIAALIVASSIEDFGLLLHERLRRLGISFREVADRAEMSRTLVYGYVSGKRLPREVPLRALLKAIEVENPLPWLAVWAEIRRQPSPSATVSVGGRNAQVNVFTDAPIPVDAHDDASMQKLRYSFRFLNHSLWQSTITFALSMIITTAGALILLVGAGLALKHAGESRANYTGLITSLSGVVITVCGGAFTVQANKARRHATEQTEQVRRELKSDLAFDRASKQIEKIQDPALRDRLFAISALKELDLSPTPVDLAKDLPTKQVESERLPGIELS